MGLKDLFTDLKEDIEWKGHEKKESKMVRKLFSTFKQNDFAMNILHMELDMMDSNVLFSFEHDERLVFGCIFAFAPFKEDEKDGYYGEYVFKICLPLPKESQWPVEYDIKVSNGKDKRSSYKDVGFDDYASYAYNEIYKGKKLTNTLWGEAFCVKKSFSSEIANSSDASNKAMDEFFSFAVDSLTEYKDILDSMFE